MHDVEITSLAHGGAGICRIEGQVCFVSFALPGDHLRIRVARQSKGVLWGEIAEILSPSPDRSEPECENFGTCGACNWDHFAYPAQAQWKRRIVQETLARVGRIDIEVGWIEDPALRRGYRTRAEFHGDGRRFGFYALGTNRILNTTRCSLCHPQINAALATLRTLRIKGSVTVTVHPEDASAGPLMWCNAPMPRVKEVFKRVNWPRDRAPRSHFTFDGIPIVNGAFSQASLLLNRLLQQEVLKCVHAADNILDLYCGNGNLSLPLAGDREVLGIDHNAAVIDAVSSLGRGRYIQGGEDAFRHALGQDKWDAVLLDPPRTGAREISGDLARADARAIVYVSCDPATLARDLKVLTAAGWSVEKATAIDLFPFTSHVETVCRIVR